MRMSWAGGGQSQVGESGAVHIRGGLSRGKTLFFFVGFVKKVLMRLPMITPNL